MKPLKQLEEENVRPKRLVANLSLDKEKLQDVIKRKLSGVLGPVNWVAICRPVTGSMSGGLVMRSLQAGQPFVTSPAVPISPVSKCRSRRWLPPLFFTGSLFDRCYFLIAASTSFAPSKGTSTTRVFSSPPHGRKPTFMILPAISWL